MIVAIIAAAVGIVGIINIASIREDDTSMYQVDAQGLEHSGAAAVNFQQLRYNVLKMTTLTDKKSIDETRLLIEQFHKTTTENLNKYKNEVLIHVDNKEIIAVMKDIDTAWGNYEPNITKYLAFVDGGKTKEGNDLVVNTMAPIGVTLRDDFLKLMQLVSDSADLRAKGNQETATTATYIMIAAVVAAVAIALILGSYISRLISKPVRKMSSVAKLLSAGDIAVDSVLDSSDYKLKEQKDEIGELAHAFDTLIETTKKQVEAIERLADGDLTVEFTLSSDKDALGKGLITLTENLNQLIGAIMTSSDQVTSGATMVSHSSMSLSQGATEQASSIEELTASLEEIATQTNVNAQSAEKANELALRASENAAGGNVHMQEMLKAMEDISMSSASINKIIKVIDDIAFQTNILALNAAVEAARAGQHGKGFAVVAEEVRTLAGRSANAAKETTDLIEDSIRKVEAGTRIANQTAGALGQIVDQVNKAADLVQSIDSASKEQAVAVEQINQGIIQVSQVVQTNAATAEESAAASEELSAQAEQLRETVSVFRIKQSAIRRESAQSSGPRNAAQKAIAPRSAAKTAGKPVLSLGENDFGKY